MFSFPTPKASGAYKVKCPHCSLINEVTLEISSNIRSIICGNAACGHSFTYNLPAKPGVFILKCPICQQANRVTINEAAPAADAKVAGIRLLAPSPKQASPATMHTQKQQAEPVEKHIERPAEYPAERTENKLVERNAEFPAKKLEERNTEPELNKPADKDIKPLVKRAVEDSVEDSVENPVEQSVNKSAKHSYEKSADDDYDADDFFEETGCKTASSEDIRGDRRRKKEADTDFDGLTLVTGGIFFRKKYNLTEGHHIIGRFDKTGESPSDFEIKDRTASLRSLRIDVSNVGGDYEYVLTVLRAFNPVKLNGVAMNSGDRAELCHGDRIQLGLTKLKVV